MTIHIGTDKVSKVYVGNDEVKKIYIGSDLVFNSTTPTPPTPTILFQPPLDGTDTFYNLPSNKGTAVTSNGELSCRSGDCQFSTTFDNTVNWKFTCKFKTTGASSRFGVSRIGYTRQNHLQLGADGSGNAREYHGQSSTGTGETVRQWTGLSSLSSYFNNWIDIEISKTGTSINMKASYNGTGFNNDTWSLSWINDLNNLAVSVTNWGNSTTYLKDILIVEV